jgi:hypothetical protein
MGRWRSVAKTMVERRAPRISKSRARSSHSGCCFQDRGGTLRFSSTRGPIRAASRCNLASVQNRSRPSNRHGLTRITVIACRSSHPDDGCQSHLLHDRPYHRAQRGITYPRRLAAGDLFPQILHSISVQQREPNEIASGEEARTISPLTVMCAFAAGNARQVDHRELSGGSILAP